jgi:hypothetical protein
MTANDDGSIEEGASGSTKVTIGLLLSAHVVAGLVLTWIANVPESTVILHSRADDVVPFADSVELVKNSGLPSYTLIEVGNDHRLADPESLEMMLGAVEARFRN